MNKYTLFTLIMVLVLAFLIFAVFYKGLFHMSNNDVFHLAGELIAFVVSILIFFGFSRISFKTNKAKMALLFFVVTTDVCLAFDIFVRLIDGEKELALCNYLLNALIFVFEIVAIILFYKFVVYQYGEIRDVYKKICRIIEIVFYIVLALSIAVSFQDKLYFSIDENGSYHTGAYYNFSLIVNIIMVTIVFSMIVSTSYFSAKRKVGYLSFPVFYATADVIGFINNSFSIELILSVWAMVFIYCMTFIELGDETRELNQNFSSYMSRDLIEEDESEEDLTADLREMDVTIMILGIVDFTKHMNTVGPDRIIGMFNHFLDMAIETCGKFEGEVLEITSNGIICVFGAKGEKKGHINKAVNAAVAIRNSMRVINEFNAQNGYPELSISCGIATGNVVLGYIGSRKHARLSAISKNINLCSRLAGIADANEIILASHVARNYDGELELSDLETIGVKGYDDPVSFYRLEDIIL